MGDSNTQLHWTDEQWNKVRQVVYEEARRARVAGNVLPLYGPLDPDERYVSRQAVQGPGPKGQKPKPITVSDSTSLRLLTIQQLVELRGAQVADPELSSALTAFRRAANFVARREDEIIFLGGGTDDEGDDVQSYQAQATPGLVESAQTPVPVIQSKPQSEDAKPEIAERRKTQVAEAPKAQGDRGGALVVAISEAIGKLEAKHQLGPFACVLGQKYFLDAQTPTNSMVLPQDRILPFLGGGALLRTSVLKEEQGLVIALGGAPIDLVVATDISVGFLQVTSEPRFVFRVYEKIVLRIKQPEAIAILQPG
jgi:uncharacterized linocin/CFP29 family protein